MAIHSVKGDFVLYYSKKAIFFVWFTGSDTVPHILMAFAPREKIANCTTITTFIFEDF